MRKTAPFHQAAFLCNDITSSRRLWGLIAHGQWLPANFVASVASTMGLEPRIDRSQRLATEIEAVFHLLFQYPRLFQLNLRLAIGKTSLRGYYRNWAVYFHGKPETVGQARQGLRGKREHLSWFARGQEAGHRSPSTSVPRHGSPITNHRLGVDSCVAYPTYLDRHVLIKQSINSRAGSHGAKARKSLAAAIND